MINGNSTGNPAHTIKCGLCMFLGMCAWLDAGWGNSCFTGVDAACCACVLAFFCVPKQLAAMRWLFHHSALEPGDAIVTGSATLQQLCANLDALDQESGPLPQGLADAIGTAWSEWRGRGPADELGQHGMRHMALARL